MAAPLRPGTAADPYSEVELTVSGRSLRNMDYFSKSDPMVVVSLLDPCLNLWQNIGRTEVMQDNLDPDFATKFVLKYHFEERQELKFRVFDIDSSDLNNLEDHDFIGFCIVSLGQIVSNGRQIVNLESSEKNTGLGQLIISAEELTPNLDDVSFHLKAQGLPRHCWTWMNLYLELHKVGENGSHVLVHRTPAVSFHVFSSDPTWPPICLAVRSLCGGDDERTIRIRCLSSRDFCMLPPHVIGEAFVTLREIRDDGKNSLDLINPNRKTVLGKLRISDFHITKNYSFLEYIMGGMQINCSVAIDFTASNGDPSIGTSLHYISNSGANQYELALQAVVDILQDYDSDKLFPVLGFGAKVPPYGHVSHEFYVNLHPDNPYCSGVEGVLSAYKTCIRQIQLYGPTNFSPVIIHVSNFARAYQDGSQYFVLLIITDGIITDMQRTKEAIIDASTLPISIIIVGVGDANFDDMSELDGDVNPIAVGSRVAARDIVQFVAFKEFLNVPNKSDAKLRLAREVLAEIPDQVVGFMKSRMRAPMLRAPREDASESRVLTSGGMAPMLRTPCKGIREDSLPPPYS